MLEPLTHDVIWYAFHILKFLDVRFSALLASSRSFFKIRFSDRQKSDYQLFLQIVGLDSRTRSEGRKSDFDSQ